MEGKEIIDNLIIGRVEPYIYAFTTNTVPNYLKIGDTYRPVPIRLNEWKKYFPDLKEEYKEKAMINSDVFFRDYSVHKYVEEELGRARLKQENLPKEIYYSNEFFEKATNTDVKKAIEDIKESYEKNDNKYQFYDANTSLPEIFQYKREEKEWQPRPNQKEAIENFKNARKNGRKNLLMYAVMRFGKSFTSMMCAKEMNADLVVIVSAKADVKLEWKKTVEIPKNFDGYSFITSEELARNNNEISERLSKNEKVAVFLTLQDLQGDLIKEKHKDVFKNKIDLLIVDETHFGARAEKYGKVLESTKYEKDIKDKHQKEEDSINDLDENIKVLDVDMTLHLSGTPYRILMGSEFEKEDIISFCQFSDIVEEQEKWNNENILNDNIKEWDNPYFGFPQMVRFAFNPSKKAKERLKEYKNNGYTYAFSALLKPKSIKKADDGSHKKFVNEQEILELFEVIDGCKEDENVLGFLNYEKIKQGKMCRHIVCVLPYCASCDALEELIRNNKENFKNLNEYEIINISGVDNSNQYRTIAEIKDKIRECEENDVKTLTLTVNRMLTGSTVEEWDTMIYLKDTSSPQEYDQAIFRLQNQYIKKYVDNEQNVIKYNMKPQTLLVDFDPYRMFMLQAKKSLIYNANTNESGMLILKKQIENELSISPIITINKSKIVEIMAKDVIDAVSEYSRRKGVLEETLEIPVDLSLLNHEEIKRVIEVQAEIGSKNSLFIDNAEGEGNDIDLPDKNDVDNDRGLNDVQEHLDNNEKENKNDPVKQFRTYYARILFYSFLSSGKLESLDEIINEIKNNVDSKTLSKNLGLNLATLISIRKNINWNILNQLDLKIRNINYLSIDSSINPLDRAKTAINKFNKLSESEIITPDFICEDMINLIKDEDFYKIIRAKGKFLDLASKMAEFPLAIYEKASLKKVDVSNSIYAIPTSTIAYEFTKKIYQILGLNIDNIAKLFTTYDLLKIKNPDTVDYNRIMTYILQNKKFSEIELEENMFFKEGGEKMKFDVVIGNPPYQLKGGSGGNNDALIFQHFANIADELKSTYTSLIIPSRWFSAGRENLVGDFRSKMINNKSIECMKVYSDATDVFSNVEIKGGICYYLINKGYVGDCNYEYKYSLNNEQIVEKPEIPRKLNEYNVLIRDYIFEGIVKKVTKYIKDKEDTVEKMISGDTPFSIGSNLKINKRELVKIKNNKDSNYSTKIYYIKNRKRASGYINADNIIKNKDDIKKYKVFIPGAYGAGEGFPHQILGEPICAEDNSLCSQSYLYAAFESPEENKNFYKYLKTKFLRALVASIKITQQASNNVYRFVPIQDFSDSSDIKWNKTINEIDRQLYNKYNISEKEITYIESMIKEMK